MRCEGTGLPAIRRHPVTEAGECPVCTRRFDWEDLEYTDIHVVVPAHTDLNWITTNFGPGDNV